MKKLFSFYWGRVLFSSLLLGAFMMSPAFASTTTTFVPTSNGDFANSDNQSGCIGFPEYTCVNTNDGASSYRRLPLQAAQVGFDTFYYGVTDLGIIENVKICSYAKSTNGVGQLRNRINTPQGIVDGVIFSAPDSPAPFQLNCDEWADNPLTGNTWQWVELQGKNGYYSAGGEANIVTFTFLEVTWRPSYTGEFLFAGGVASISTALFDDMGQGGILELIIGISLGLLLLDYLIGHFRAKRAKKNEFTNA